MRQICYSTDGNDFVNGKNCESYELCNTVFGVVTPKMILDKLKVGTH